MSKYKVGDRVRVREDLQPSLPTGIRYGTYGANMNMIALRGEIVTIKSVHLDDSYSLQENGWLWTDEMFAGLAEKPLIDIEFEEKHRGDVMDAVGYAFHKLYGKSVELFDGLDAADAPGVTAAASSLVTHIDFTDMHLSDIRELVRSVPDDADAPTIAEPDDFKVGDYVRVLAEWDDERYQDVGKIILALENDHCFVRFEDKEEKSYQNYDLKKLTTGEPHPEIKSSLEERAEAEKKPRIGTIEMVLTEEKKQEIIEEIKDAYMKFIYDRPAVEPDPVNHPAHYNHGGIETDDIIRMLLTPEEYAGWLKGNVIKYRDRAPWKHETPDEDWAKAKVYYDKYIESEEL